MSAPLLSAYAAADRAYVPDAYIHPGVSLSQLLNIVHAHRKASAIVVLAMVVLAALATKLAAPSYRATAMLMVDYEVNDPLSGKDFPVGLMGSYMATQIELIRSPAVLLSVVDQLHLEDNEDYMAGYSPDSGSRAEWARSQLASHLEVEQGQWGSRLIYIHYTGTSARHAAAVANTVAQIYEDQQSQRLNGPAGQRERRYSEQLNALKARLDKAQSELTAFRQRNELLGSDDDTGLALDRLNNLQQRLLEAQQQRRDAEAALRGTPSTRDSAVSASSIVQLRNQLADQQGRMRELSTTLGPRHPEIVELQARIDATRQALDAETRLYSDNGRNRLDAARSMESQLRVAIDEELKRVLERRKLLDQATQYELELKTAQTLYGQALNGYDQVVLSSGSGYNNVSLISAAAPPVSPTGPKLLKNLVLGLAAGLLFGLAGPLVYEFLFRKIRCRDDLDRDFGLPVLVELGPAAIGRMA